MGNYLETPYITWWSGKLWIWQILYPKYDFKFEKELPKAKSEAFIECDFEYIPNLKLYEISLDRKNKIINLTEYYIGDWKKDSGGRACMICKFWKNEINDDSQFTFYRNALRLVVFTQLSSCAFEQVLSQIKFIVGAAGHTMT